VIASLDQNYLVVKTFKTVQDNFFDQTYQDFFYENDWNDIHFHILKEEEQLVAMRIWWEKIITLSFGMF
jgi:hypothetical protein